MAKYDDASWHYGGDFPADLPAAAGGTHIGLFLAWAIRRGLASAMHTLGSPAEQPGAYFLAECDEKLTHHDLTDEGNAFAAAYYDRQDPPNYLLDYSMLFVDEEGEVESVYHVPDTLDSLEALSPILDQRLAEFRAGGF